jgi:hypothetical protein
MVELLVGSALVILISATRYYFVADRVARGDLCIEHCPTEGMIADYFTKPLQGTPFYKLRDLVVMNIDPSSPCHSSQRSVLNNGDPGNLGSIQDVCELISSSVEARKSDGGHHLPF